MCFSATASFTAGAALLIVGAVTTRRVTRRAELPYALIPVLFGVQQLIEGALWLALPADVPLLKAVLTHAFSFFSHVLWPLYIPLAVLLLESAPWRRRVLVFIGLAGAAVGLYLLYFLLRLPIVAEVSRGHIAYLSPHFYLLPVMGLYLLGTCASSLSSSHWSVRWFGAAALVSFLGTYAFYAFWLISVWCFFAALLSVLVLLHFPRGGRTEPPYMVRGWRARFAGPAARSDS